MQINSIIFTFTTYPALFVAGMLFGLAAVVAHLCIADGYSLGTAVMFLIYVAASAAQEMFSFVTI